MKDENGRPFIIVREYVGVVELSNSTAPRVKGRDGEN